MRRARLGGEPFWLGLERWISAGSCCPDAAQTVDAAAALAGIQDVEQALAGIQDAERVRAVTQDEERVRGVATALAVEQVRGGIAVEARGVAIVQDVEQALAGIQAEERARAGIRGGPRVRGVLQVPGESQDAHRGAAQLLVQAESAGAGRG